MKSMNNTYIGGGIFLSEEEADLFMNMDKYFRNKDISEELLHENNWGHRYGNLGNYFHIDLDDNKYHLELSPYSNMIGRDWNVHVDNCDFESIGSCCIQNIKQFNDFMKILEIPYELH